ncbi:MAG: LytTR family DNA-binding domain-containing protein [Bacteroidota bacterium]
MKAIIVEDEKHARDHLQHLLHSINPEIEILAQLESVEATAKWLDAHEPELIFLDIHLADDLSFSLFEQRQIDCPVIFTTAYDQYAIQAFKVNSIDYLLKPIDPDELRAALDKFQRLAKPESIQIKALEQIFTQTQSPSYQKRFLVKKGEKISSVKVSDIAYFEGEDRYVSLIKRDGQRYFVDYKLADLEGMLDPNEFFRLNRSFICHFDAIDNMHALSKSRVKVNLDPPSKREIIVSTDNTRLFKEWLNR